MNYLVSVAGLSIDVNAVSVVRSKDDAEQRLEETDVGMVQDGVSERKFLLRGGLLQQEKSCYFKPVLRTTDPSQDSSVGSILAWYWGGPGFKSRQGKEFFNEKK